QQVKDVGPAPEVEGEGLPVGRHHHLGEPGHAGHVGRREGAVRGHRPGVQIEAQDCRGQSVGVPSPSTATTQRWSGDTATLYPGLISGEIGRSSLRPSSSSKILLPSSRLFPNSATRFPSAKKLAVYARSSPVTVKSCASPAPVGSSRIRSVRSSVRLTSARLPSADSASPRPTP